MSGMSMALTATGRGFDIGRLCYYIAQQSDLMNDLACKIEADSI